MRKTLPIIIYIVILAIITNVLAYEEEINFQGIPWGSTHAETEKLFKESFGKSATAYGSIVKDIDSTMRYDIKITDGKVEFTPEVVKVDVDSGIISDTIAGCKPESIIFGFYCNEQEERLQEVSVKIHADNLQEATDGITEFFSEMYGDPYTSEAYTPDPYSFGRTAWWIGTNNTYAYVFIDEASDIWIYFGKTIGEEE